MGETENYLILFADLIGSTEVACEASASIFSRNYISSFHWAAKKAEMSIKTKEPLFRKQKFKKTIDKIKIAGDEVLSFTPIQQLCQSKEDFEDMVASSVAFAVDTKLYWLASPYNLRRMCDKHFPRDIAVGIHIGPAAAVPIEKGEDSQIASLHINVTKSIESQARKGSESRIFASSDVVEKFNGWLERHKKDEVKDCSPILFAKFKQQENEISVKGIPKKLKLNELVLPSESKHKLDKLMSALVKTPKTKKAEVVNVSKILAEKFFGEDLFKYDNDTPAINIENLGVKTIPDYIRLWFKAVDQQTMLFSDEKWFVLNCLLISGALLRHKEVQGRKEQGHYIKIAERIYEQLKALE